MMRFSKPLKAHFVFSFFASKEVIGLTIPKIDRGPSSYPHSQEKNL